MRPARGTWTGRREVFLLGVGKLYETYNSAVDILNRLVPCKPGELLAIDDWHWRAAALAGEAALDLRLPERAPGNLYHENVLERLRTWLQVLLEGGHLAPRPRLGAGDTLGRLGDSRRGVGRLPLVIHGKTVELPDLDWVHIPAGRFRMGSAKSDKEAYAHERPQHPLELGEFWIARYPLTNAQYRSFVEAPDYTGPGYWTAEGRAWLQGGEPDFSALESIPIKIS